MCEKFQWQFKGGTCEENEKRDKNKIECLQMDLKCSSKEFLLIMGINIVQFLLRNCFLISSGFKNRLLLVI